MEFQTNVFINCPFDSNYLPLLRPLLFTVIDLGLTPRIALESLDSGAPRIERIVALIRDSKFGIHDLSRLRAAQAGEFFRLNMPFELGIDVGCRHFKPGKWSEKRCLILEAEKYRYQAALSDMSNSDIAAHGNDPQRIISEVRNWLNNEARLRAAGPAKLWGRFNDFMAENYDALTARGFSPYDIENLPVPELMRYMQEWVRAHP